MKLLISFSIFLFSSILIAQDSTETDRIYREYNDEVFYKSIPNFPFTLVMDSSTMKPINGWLIKDYLKTILVEHYIEGKQIGFRLKYDLKKSHYHITEASYSVESEFLRYVQLFNYNPKYQSIDSSSISYGLVSIRTFHPDSNNNKLIARDINLKKQPFRIKDRYYFSESNKSVNVKYKVNSTNHLWNTTLSDSIQKTFPFMLNENKNSFSLIRYDGHYENHIHQGEKKYRCSKFIKFYPNGTVKFAFVEGVQKDFKGWDELNPYSFQLNGNSISFKIPSTELDFKNGRFYPTFLKIDSKLFSGIYQTMIWQFKKSA